MKQKLLQAIDIPLWMAPALKLALGSPPIVKGHLLPPLARQLGESQRVVWLMVVENSRVALARKGSCPGNALAEMLYNVMLVKVLDEG